MIFTREQYPILMEKDIGCSVPDTWFPHVKLLVDSLQDLMDNSPVFSSLRIIQIKEKFGSLRVYTDFNPEVRKEDWFTEDYYKGLVSGMIQMTSIICSNTCVECGSNKDIINTTKGKDGGWISPRCPDHR